MRWLYGLLVVLAACSPLRQPAIHQGDAFVPRFETDRFYSFDGAELGLTVWEGQGPRAGEIVIVGLHGMNDWANAFHMAAPWWAAHGVTTYAYDQRGFGRSPSRGIWPDSAFLRNDLRTAIAVARERHPDARIAVVGISMGGAVAMTTFAETPPEGADVLVLSGPGLRGWGALPLTYRFSLWASARTRPGWIVRPPRFVTIWPSDNIEMLRRNSEDEMMLGNNRIDLVEGVVSLMEDAHRAVESLPDHTLVLYGAKDQVIPPAAMRRTAERLPTHVRSIFYPDGYHMLLRDRQAETVYRDVLAFIRDPEAPAPSGLGALPWSPRE